MWLRFSFFVRLLMLVFIIVAASTIVCMADSQEIFAEYTYQMGSSETPIDAEKNAILEAKRIAIEQAGTYLESYSKTENFKLTKDEISAIAAGILETEVIDKKVSVANNAVTVWVKIKAKVDTANLKAKMQDRTFIEENQRLQNDNKQLLQELAEIKQKLQATQDEALKKQVQVNMNENQQKLRANDWFEEGYRAQQVKQYDVAIAAYNKAIELSPQLAEAYNNRGIAYAAKGQLDNAIKDYIEAIRIDPQDAEAYYNRGNAYDAKGQLDAAMSDYNEAIRINPQEAFAYNNRGLAYYNKGQLDAAFNDYNEAIRINPQDAEAYNNRGNAYYNKGQLDAAINDYSEAIRINPQYAGAYNNRGTAYDDKGQLDNAIKDYNEAIRIDPQLAEAYNNRGTAYNAKGQLDAAINDYNEAIRINPQDAGAYYNKGLACATLGRYQEVMDAFYRFIAYAPPQYTSQIKYAKQYIRALGGRI